MIIIKLWMRQYGILEELYESLLYVKMPKDKCHISLCHPNDLHGQLGQPFCQNVIYVSCFTSDSFSK